MSAEMYADNVANIKDQIAKLQADRIDNYDSLANSITEKYNEQMQGYTEKWRTVAEAGGEDLAGLLGAKGVYKGGKKLYDLYKARQARKKALQEKETEQQQKDVGDDDEFDEDPQELPDTQGGRKMFQDEDDLDENQDWYNDAGEKYFTGSEAQHEEYYNEDGTLKDPTNVPDGHQANSNDIDGDDETPDNDEQNQGLDEEDDDVDVDVTQNPAMNDVTGSGANDGQYNFGDDEFADDPTFLNPSIQPNTSILGQPSALGTQESTAGRTFAQQRPTDEQLEIDPFQPTANQPISSSFTRTTQNVSSGGDPPPINDGEANALVGGEQDAVKAGISDASEEGSSILENISQAGKNVFQNLAQRGQNIRQGFQNVKNFFSKSAGDTTADATTAADTAAETAATAGGEAGGELAGLGIGDAVLGAIPVVGEIGLAVSGLVAIGEGLYHLFHPHKNPVKTPAPPPLTAPQTMTQKYSMALPSADASLDRAGSVSAF